MGASASTMLLGQTYERQMNAKLQEQRHEPVVENDIILDDVSVGAENDPEESFWEASETKQDTCITEAVVRPITRKKKKRRPTPYPELISPTNRPSLTKGMPGQYY